MDTVDSRQNNDIVYEWHGADPAAAAVDLVKDPSFRLAENLKADHCESEMYTGLCDTRSGDPYFRTFSVQLSACYHQT